MILKLAVRNVLRSAHDYSVYFATLAFAACLLYSFTASGDYLLSLDLTADQRGIYESASMITQAFSVFSALVFAFLVTYANRFILRRRSREFATYGIMGMEPATMARILVYEGCVAAVVALAVGMLVGVLASPLFGAVAAFVFDAPWQLLFVFSADAALWTAECFAGLMVLALALEVRSLRKHSLLELLDADSTPEQPKGTARLSVGFQTLLAVVLLAVVWGSCLFQPVQFIVWILPMGVAAVLATGMLFRVWAIRRPERARRRPDRLLVGLRLFDLRQLQARMSLSANAMACTCVLIAVAVCMMVAGLAFSVGMRDGFGQLSSHTLAPIGYVGIFYGITFLVAAAAVLALQQLAGAADDRQAYRMLGNLGCDAAMMRRSIRSQVGTCFALPMAFALVHDVFGLALVAFLAYTLGSAQFPVIVAGVVGVTVALLGVYYLITCRECGRMLLPQESE
ncbi:FtsX-like permease family protein [Adlercreutzia murintestinalis]|uniref:FtsX-like permease family protein n=1 Tax=Adlercreutzia murintestinalis TaxID=2941325 RepID=UPI00203F4D75|nr:FtsX-like permease family protein [Adlercreutzia murintestinalis]